MYNVTIYMRSGQIHSLRVWPLSLARSLVAQMGDQVDSANIYTNKPVIRLKG